jgi:phosphoadenosine phosphosulfate reductase
MLDNAKHLNDIVESYAGLEGRELIRAAIKNHPGKVALLSSFGAESSVLLHMVSEIDPSLPVIFLDTEKLFPETLTYRDKLVEEFGLTNLIDIHPDAEDIQRVDPDGVLHRFDKDLCCHFRKTVPMQKAFAPYDIIISGRKRFHGAVRSNLEFVSVQDGKVKLEPLAASSALDLHNYMVTHHLPSHPLKLQGFRSIGCMPCTAQGGTDDNPRAGRWAGTDKTECGIHFAVNGTVIRPTLAKRLASDANDF